MTLPTAVFETELPGVRRIARGKVRDVYDDPAYGSQRDEMAAVLDAWWQRQKENYPATVKSYLKAR